MAEISLRGLFQDFNASKFVVYCSVLLFSLFFALREDGVIDWPFWLIFTPLWIWKTLTLSGAVIGCVSHCKRPPARNDIGSELEFRSMILCAGEHLLLLMFEILCCYKLDNPDSPLYWILIFIPLIFLSVISLVICIWSVRQEKSFEFELFFSVNVLQFVFLAIKLDNMVEWDWAVIFIPLWILICLSMIGVLYAIILAVLLIRSIDLLPERRRQHVWSAIGYTLLVIPILIFLVMLTGKLDGVDMSGQDRRDLSYVVVCSPLYVSLACLMLLACATRGGNTWWFGMRQEFCMSLLDTCPCLQEYGNVSYKFGTARNSTARTEADTPDSGTALRQQEQRGIRVSRETRPVCAVVSIECPD